MRSIDRVSREAVQQREGRKCGEEVHEQQIGRGLVAIIAYRSGAMGNTVMGEFTQEERSKP